MNDASFHARVRAPVHPIRTCGLPLAKSLFLGLLATWVTSVLLQPQPSRAETMPASSPPQCNKSFGQLSRIATGAP